MGNNNMTRVEKEQIFLNRNKKTDTNIMRNKGESVYFGDTSILVKALEWDLANEFEDEVERIFNSFDEVQQNASKMKKSDLSIVMKKLLREDIISLANKATEGLVTIDYIRKRKATKDDVIKVSVKAIEMNYGYAKNLIAQRPL